MSLGAGTYVPLNQRDHRWGIFKKKFLCRVPNIHMMSTDYVKHFGMPSYGDPDADRQTANELITTMLTVAEMVGYYKRGVTVRVVKIPDTKEIYEHITDHLNAWKKELEVGWHTRNAPIEDLLELDKFANAVYRFAAPQFTTQTVDSILARRMSGTLRVSRDKIMGGNKPKVMIVNAVGEKEEVSKIPERVGMADSLLGHKAAVSGAAKWRS
jgi:hypothetical protein